MALTKLQCDHAVCPPDKARTRLTDEHGRFLQVTAAGEKYWRMKYRFAGKEKVIAFGVYPEVTLAEARERLEQARRLLRDGQDPLELGRDRKQKLIVAAADSRMRVLLVEDDPMIGAAIVQGLEDAAHAVDRSVTAKVG